MERLPSCGNEALYGHGWLLCIGWQYSVARVDRRRYQNQIHPPSCQYDLCRIFYLRDIHLLDRKSFHSCHSQWLLPICTHWCTLIHQTYIVDTYLWVTPTPQCFPILTGSTVRMQAATALTANTMIRSLVGSVVPLFTVQMFRNLGIQWAATLIAAICLVLMPIPFLFFKYGARIRSKSQFAPCLVWLSLWLVYSGFDCEIVRTLK